MHLVQTQNNLLLNCSGSCENASEHTQNNLLLNCNGSCENASGADLKQFIVELQWKL